MKEILSCTNFAIESDGRNSMQKTIQLLQEKSINASVISNRGVIADTKAIAEATGGLMDDTIISSYADEVVAHIKQHHETHNRTYRTLAATGWKEITLDKPIVSDYKRYLDGEVSWNDIDYTNFADTDGDGLFDLKEIAYYFNGVDVVNFDGNGNVILPTIEECMDLQAGNTYVENALSQYTWFGLHSIQDIRILPINSDPTLGDSDFDYTSDKFDDKPLKWKITEIKDKWLDDSKSVDGQNYDFSSLQLNNGATFNTERIGEGTSEHNVLNYSRKNSNDYLKNNHHCEFKIKPNQNSDYLIKVSNVNSKNDVKISVTYETRFSTETVSEVEPDEDSNGSQAAEFYFALEKDKEYTISFKVNSRSEDYTVSFSQNNWVYAPNGGRQSYRNSQVSVDNLYVKLALVTNSDDFNSVKIKDYNYTQIEIAGLNFDMISLEGVIFIKADPRIGAFLTICGLLTTPLYQLLTEFEQNELDSIAVENGGFVCFSNLHEDGDNCDYIPTEWKTPNYICKYVGNQRYRFRADIQTEVDRELLGNIIYLTIN